MRPLHARAKTFLLLLATIVSRGPAALGQTPPTLTVDANATRHPISPQIYGIANYGLDTTFAKEIQVPNVRWGGDGTTRYNWMVDASNAGFDWYFMGGNGEATPTPSATADLMVNTYKPASALITIPIIPYVNKLSAWNCSFPVSIYGAQQSTNPYVHPNGDSCGNSIATSGTQLVDNNIYANHIDNTPSLQQQWVQHLVSTFGTAANGGVKFYQLDNEPYGWGNTHRDVMPNGATYPTITSLGQQYAAAIKQADSTALVLGPSDFTLGGWVGDTTKQGGLWAGQYYLQQMAAYDQGHGERILDYFDEHYYPQFSNATEQLASTRTLWDPTYNGGTWVEQYDFNGPMQLIPRFRSWISTYYPGTLLSISEYSIDSGQKLITDALAEMDVLGIFGREPLDFASMWTPPAPQDPIAFAFRMFRNYDGNGGQFGDTSISAASTDQAQLAVYAAQRSSDNAVTILAINKTTAAISTTLAVANVNLPSAAQVYTYAQGSLTSIAHGADASISNGSISYTFPAYSAVEFVVHPAAAALIATTTTLTSSAAQTTSGQTVTFSAAVAAASGATPTGNVTFLDGTSMIGTSALASGVATFAISSLTVGSHSITASYPGNATDGASASTAVTLQVSTPAPQATTTTLAATPATVVAGQSVSMTANVTPASASGTVTFQDGSTSIGTGTLSSGSAVFSSSTLSVGSHALTAVYGGDAADAGSGSAPVSIMVTSPATAPPAANYTLSLSSSTLSMAQGGSGSITISVAPQNGFNASLTFACNGLPSGWGCAFAPATLSGSGPESTMMTISPSATGIALAFAWPTILFGLLAGRRRKFLLCGLLLLSGCATSTSNNPPATTGTYNVTVTASGQSAPTHTQAFTLTLTQ